MKNYEINAQTKRRPAAATTRTGHNETDTARANKRKKETEQKTGAQTAETQQANGEKTNRPKSKNRNREKHDRPYRRYFYLKAYRADVSVPQRNRVWHTIYTWEITSNP